MLTIKNDKCGVTYKVTKGQFENQYKRMGFVVVDEQPTLPQDTFIEPIENTIEEPQKVENKNKREKGKK